MKKRPICALLAFVMLLGLVSGVSLRVKAESNLHASDALIDLLKELEGFTGKCIVDSTQRSVGYGTRCDVCDPSMPGYLDPNRSCSAYNDATPISDEHAVYLMRKFLTYFENKVNGFADKHGLTLSQQQFDALITFTYNCGEGWMLPSYDSEGTFRNAIAQGKTGDELVYAFGLWSKSKNIVSLGHIKRRMIEANIYLNGDYTNDWPDMFRYAFLDANGGETKYYYQTFYAEEECPIRADFTSIPKDEDGKELTFAGWFTQREGGFEVKNLSGLLTNGMILYAHWKNDKGEIVTLDAEKETQVDVHVVVPYWWPDSLYEGPGTFYSVTRHTIYNEQLHITKTVTGKDGQLWGYCSDGWIPLKYTNYNDVINSTSPDGKWYEITSVVTKSLSVRSEPRKSGTLIGHKYAGNQVLIVKTQDEEGAERTWGQMTDGNWICIKEDGSDYAAIMDPQPDIKPAEVNGEKVSSITIAKMPTVQEYILNSNDVLPNLDGAQLQVNYSNGRKDTVAITRHMVSGFNNTKLGTNTITVSYGGQTAEFTVEIIPTTITAVEMGSMPKKTEYICKEEKLDLTGATLKVIYDNVEERTVALTADMVTGFDNSKVGTNTLTVTYKGFTLSFDVAITKPVVTFVNYDGTVISQERYDLGEKVSPPADPTRPLDDRGEYEFAGWDKKVVACEGSTTYTAKYKLKYPIGDIDRNGSVNDDDVIYFLYHIVYPEQYAIYCRPDFDHNGAVDDDDVIYLLYHVVYPEQYPLNIS